jgi:hypothetical protein
MAKFHYQNIFKDSHSKNITDKVFNNKNHCFMGSHDNFSKYLDFLNFSDFIQVIHYFMD